MSTCIPTPYLYLIVIGSAYYLAHCWYGFACVIGSSVIDGILWEQRIDGKENRLIIKC